MHYAFRVRHLRADTSLLARKHFLWDCGLVNRSSLRPYSGLYQVLLHPRRSWVDHFVASAIGRARGVPTL